MKARKPRVLIAAKSEFLRTLVRSCLVGFSEVSVVGDHESMYGEFNRWGHELVITDLIQIGIPNATFLLTPNRERNDSSGRPGRGIKLRSHYHGCLQLGALLKRIHEILSVKKEACEDSKESSVSEGTERKSESARYGEAGKAMRNLLTACA